MFASNAYAVDCKYNSTLPTLSNQDGIILQCDSSGHLLIAGTFSAGVDSLTSTNLSSTVAVTNTFQSIQIASATRKGCSIQNNGTNSMWVFFGPIASATKNSSVQLSSGQSVTCASGSGGVLGDQISITGTAADVFFAAVQ
jgi:hypothetical protein